MRYMLVIFCLILLSGCGHKKLVAKNCEKAGNEDLYVCDPI